MLRIEEVAVMVGVSTQTINNWYKFKKKNPDNEHAKELPDYIVDFPKKTRLWDCKDIEALQKFRESLPKGRNGILGSVTQKYSRNKKG